MKQLFEARMGLIYQNGPEKGGGEAKLVYHLPHGRAGWILAELFIETTDPKWTDQYNGHIHLPLTF